MSGELFSVRVSGECIIHGLTLLFTGIRDDEIIRL